MAAPGVGAPARDIAQAHVSVLGEVGRRVFSESAFGRRQPPSRPLSVQDVLRSGRAPYRGSESGADVSTRAAVQTSHHPPTYWDPGGS
jgi:hypothetical protein